MVLNLLHAFVTNLAYPALIVSAGILLLVANRDAFEIDPKPREDVDPATGVTTRRWQWKYGSDRAENARLEILHLTRVLRLAAVLMIAASVSFFGLGGAIGVLGWLGYTQLAKELETSSSIQLVIGHGLGIVFILVGPVLIFRLMRVVRNILIGRDTPADRKPPSWTPY